MRRFIYNIKTIFGIRPKECLRVCGEEMKNPFSLDNAWISVRDGVIENFGSMATEYPLGESWDDTTDAEGGLLMRQPHPPCLCRT